MWRIFDQRNFEHGIHLASRYFLGKSTMELAMQDENKILIQMCQEKHLKHLRKFKHSTLIGLVSGDQFSPYCTSNISQSNPDDTKYKQNSKLGLSFHIEEHKEITLEKDLKEMGNLQKNMLEEIYFNPKMMESLRSIPWRRLNLFLSFPKCKSLMSIDKWLIQIHNLPIGNVFLSKDDYGDEILSLLQEESCKFLIEFINLLKIDLEN
jgi:hypothetical protein